MRAITASGDSDVAIGSTRCALHSSIVFICSYDLKNCGFSYHYHFAEFRQFELCLISLYELNVMLMEFQFGSRSISNMNICQ